MTVTLETLKEQIEHVIFEDGDALALLNMAESLEQSSDVHKLTVLRATFTATNHIEDDSFNARAVTLWRKTFDALSDDNQKISALEAMQEVLANTTTVIVNSNSGNNMIYVPLDKLMDRNGRTDTVVPYKAESQDNSNMQVSSNKKEKSQ